MVTTMFRKEFLAELDASLGNLGYADRSQFIRDAIFDYLSRHGHTLPPILKAAPSRKGKGGTPTHKSRTFSRPSPPPPSTHNSKEDNSR